MAARSIASLSLSFGLVSIPVKLYSATESAGSVRFNLLAKDGSRLKQQYVSEKDQRVVERADMVKGYEFESDRFVVFEADELKALQESPSATIDIVAFIPAAAVDPIFYDKAYFLAPDKRGAKPYNLLMEAMRQSGRCALAKWAWKAKQYVVQVRPAADGLVLQQLLYAEEVRSLKELAIEKTTVSDAELKLAMQLIEQISQDTYDPTMFEDEEKKRILAAIDEKIAGKHIVAAEHVEPLSGGGQVIDLVEALRASLGVRANAGGATKAGTANPRPAVASVTPIVSGAAPAVAEAKAASGAAAVASTAAATTTTTTTSGDATPVRKGVRRAAKTEAVEAPVRVRAKK